MGTAGNVRVERMITTWQALIVIDCVLEWALTKNPTPGDQRSEVRPDSFIYRSPRRTEASRSGEINFQI